MLKKTWLTLVATLVAFSSFAFAHVISYSLYKTVTRTEFREMLKKRHLPKFIAPSKYTVDIYDVSYTTKWHDGTPIKATGLYYVPRSSKPLAELIYHHGTRVERGRKDKLGNEENLCLGMAMDGYVVIQPDYIGLGEGDKFHLYQHAESEGQAAVDMLFAARELEDSLKIKTSGMLFLTGYSQGGHATLATQKLIQDKYSDQIHVTASSAMSGAYDMAGAQSEVMFKPYSKPHYLPYLLHSYNEVYHFMPDINAVYKSPYDTIIPRMFDGSHTYKQIDAMLPPIPKDMIKDTFLNVFAHNPDYPLNVAIRENSLCDWKPEVPTQLCYCDSDEQVTCRNAFVAYKDMKALGAKHVTLREAGKDIKHSKCAIVSMIYTKMYFDSFRKGSTYGRRNAPGLRLETAIVRAAIKKSDKKEHDKAKTS